MWLLRPDGGSFTSWSTFCWAKKVPKQSIQAPDGRKAKGGKTASITQQASSLCFTLVLKLKNLERDCPPGLALDSRDQQAVEGKGKVKG